MNPKRLGKRILCALLEAQVRRLKARHDFRLVAVAGSVGKTSTKLAIAHTLEVSQRVIYQSGNYNDRLTVPLVLFGRTMPGLFNIPAWLKILIRNEQTIRLPKYYDVAVVELGTDGPGQIHDFAYLQPDVTVVTAITPEHMEYFGTLDAVAAEELTVCDFSKQVLVNADDISAQYLERKHVIRFGIDKGVEYQAEVLTGRGLQGTDVLLRLANAGQLQATAAILGHQGIKVLLAAAATADVLRLAKDEIERGIQEVKPFSGRMNILRGIKNSTIIDDTYNASPVPVIAALDVLYSTEALQRVAILGTMNELGNYSQAAHEEVGKHCQAESLDLVVTIGKDAETYLAPAARSNGCNVVSFSSPYAAGTYVAEQLQQGAVVLAEGSQNGVFAEEALKPLLTDAQDVQKLVRQSEYWIRIKQSQFNDASN